VKSNIVLGAQLQGHESQEHEEEISLFKEPTADILLLGIFSTWLRLARLRGDVPCAAISTSHCFHILKIVLNVERFQVEIKEIVFLASNLSMNEKKNQFERGSVWVCSDSSTKNGSKNTKDRLKCEQNENNCTTVMC
jgi:hypothetical protein